MNEEEQQSESKVLGPGHILKQARERARLTSQDIADKIKLKKALIEDIEQDNYDIKLSLTFVKGYLKLYAKHVGVEESEVMSAFSNLNTQDKEPAKLQSFSRRFANQANDDKLMLVTYLIVAAVIALVVVWWLQQGSDEADTLPEATTRYSSESDGEIRPLSEDSNAVLVDVATQNTQSNSQSMSASEIDEADSELPQANTTQSDLVNAEVAPVEEPTATLNNLEVAESQTEQAVAPVELVFEFSENCWMSLTDATGENIAYGVKVKGRVMPISGIPPFVVTLGAPEAVQIRYAGEAIDMSFIAPGRTAKFELPLSE
jgi:cytoskeleton protein RodZ